MIIEKIKNYLEKDKLSLDDKKEMFKIYFELTGDKQMGYHCPRCVNKVKNGLKKYLIENEE